MLAKHYLESKDKHQQSFVHKHVVVALGFGAGVIGGGQVCLCHQSS